MIDLREENWLWSNVQLVRASVLYQAHIIAWEVPRNGVPEMALSVIQTYARRLSAHVGLCLFTQKKLGCSPLVSMGPALLPI